MQQTPHYRDHYEVDRRLEQLQSQGVYYLSSRSSVPHPDTIRGWIYKDEMIFPFVSAPDMANDSEINRFKQYLEINDAASLNHEIINLQSNLKDCRFIDRMNRYKISRRLSFIIKNVRHNPAMHYLLQVHKANRLEDVCFNLERLCFHVNTHSSIDINGQQVKLNDQRVSEIVQVARRLVEQKSIYQVEKQKYPEASIGGELLDQSPILAKIDSMLQKNNSLNEPFIQQKTSINPSDVQSKITANPATDFHTYAQEIGEAIDTLKNAGKWTIETVEYFTLGFVEGVAQHVVHVVKHPVQYIQDNAEFVKQLTLFCADICSQPDELYASQEEIALFEERIQNRVEQVATLYHHLSETIPQMSRKDWGRVSGQLFADFGIAKGIGKSLHLAKNTQVSDIIRENPLIAKVRNRLEEALLNPEMVTTEGLVVKRHQGIESTNILKNTAEKVKGMTESIHPKLTENIAAFQKLDKSLTKAVNMARKERSGRILDNINVAQYEQIELDTVQYYEKIRNTSDDISQIARNIGIDASIIEQIKKHVFLEDHILYDGVRRFDPNPDMAAAWKRLIDNKFFQSDLVLLQHEFAESVIMNGVEVAYSEAHKIANSLYNWDNTL
jgi:hypothetical protein